MSISLAHSGVRGKQFTLKELKQIKDNLQRIWITAATHEPDLLPLINLATHDGQLMGMLRQFYYEGFAPPPDEEMVKEDLYYYMQYLVATIAIATSIQSAKWVLMFEPQGALQGAVFALRSLQTVDQRTVNTLPFQTNVLAQVVYACSVAKYPRKPLFGVMEMIKRMKMEHDVAMVVMRTVLPMLEKYPVHCH